MEAVSLLFPYFTPHRKEVNLPEISLNDLPRDIILIVVQMEVNVPKWKEINEDALESMRLVSVGLL